MGVWARQRADGCYDAIRQVVGATLVCKQGDGGKLFATIAAGETTGLLHAVLERLGDGAQAGVTFRVAVVVVVGLEIVDIGDQHGQHAVAVEVVAEFGDARAELAPVCDTGEYIGAGDTVQFAVCLRKLGGTHVDFVL